MSEEMISYTLPQEELENLLLFQYGKKIDPVDVKQLAKHKSNQQRARQFNKKEV